MRAPKPGVKRLSGLAIGLHIIHQPRDLPSLTSVLAEPFTKASGFCPLEACLVLFPLLLQNSKGPEWLGA